MPTFLKKLFEQYAKRLLTNKVRPSILEEGIMTIPNNKRVTLMAENLYKDFKKAGVPDNILKTENDIKVFHHKIAEMNNENIAREFDHLLTPKKPAEVFDLKGNKIKNPQNIMGGEELPGEINIFSNKYLNDLDKKIIDSDAFGYSQKEWNNLSNSSKEKFRKQFDSNYEDAMENTQMATLKEVETEAQILKRLNKENKESLSNLRYEKAVKSEEAKAAADEDYIMKVLDPEDFATGGRAGLYRGGQAEIEPDLSDIGHGSDALMARNALLTPGSQATTSTGLNYLLGEDNDTTRVPYGHGEMVLPKEKPMNEYMLKQLMSQAGAETLDAETREMLIQEYKKKIREKNKKADGGPARQNFSMGKRAFLKWMASGAAGIAGLKSGLLGFGGKQATKKAVTETVKSAGSGAPPPYFFKLVEKIKKLGDDVTETGALAERQNVKQYKDFTLTEDTATGRIEIQKVKTDAGEEFGKDNFGNGLTEEVYMGYSPGETIIVKGKPVKTGPQYDEGTAYLRNDGPNTGDVYEEVSGVTDDILEEVGEAIVKKADGGRIGYSKGKIVTEGIPALIKKIQDKFGKKSITTLESPSSFDNYEVSPDFNIKRPESAIIRDKMKNFGKPGKFNDDGTIDYDYYAQAINDSENTFVYGDETIEELESMLQKNQEYMDDMYSQYKAEGGSKRLGGPNDPMKAAIDNASPGYTGDLKYDAQLVADDLAEKMYGVEYDDLTQAQQMDLYDKAYTALSKNEQGFKQMQNLSKPKKTLEGIKKTGVVDISDPDVAEEFTKFMKETDPKGYKDMEQKIQLESFDPKKTKGNAEGGRITYSSGGLAGMLGE